MSEVLELEATLRENFGTGNARDLRRKGYVPAVIYGAGREVLAVSVAEKEITKYYRKPGFISTVINLKLDGNTHKVLPKEIQLHPVTDIVRHVDFVNLEQKVQKMQVPIVYEGKDRALGIKRGGFFNIIKRTITLLCDVNNIPKNVTIDVSNMHIGQSLKAKNIILPEGTKLAAQSDFILATIIGRKGNKAEGEEIAAEAANYPFCTIEPNLGRVSVADERLQKLASIAGSAKIIPAYIEFVDIAGLVKGASAGEGKGNKFLSHIKEVDAILHVLRCFEDDDITHVYNRIDPIEDAEIIETELMLADLESVEKRLRNAEKHLKSGDKTLKEQVELLKEVQSSLQEGRPVRDLIGTYSKASLDQLQLLTSKPILYACNVSEKDAVLGNKLTKLVDKKTQAENAKYVIISSKIEADIAVLESPEEKLEFLNSMDLTETGLNKIIKEVYNLLDLKSFFTIGPKEAHAWTFKNGILAPRAAGIIHTDFEKGFIRAEIISYNDYINLDGEAKAKEAGKMRLEGKDYKMQDGDVVHFRFNV
ncbi:Ribosome-binding ATPase YchF [Pseudolycoriella hygida]|uniref:Obg-like ATPase 1 n=3 Tax=cellular organisms TaxID=131567 RepID=A0A9Q0N7F4_9DIPT|nr:Ribosome-binding ATPase YchF [Pseudolycoriella hygida]